VSAVEAPILFECEGSPLLGILHPAAAPARRGVLIVVGGAQYRVGSHRQFVLLARALAEAGIPAMRFDYRGMGDSEGKFHGFESIGDDITAAIGAFRAHTPGLEEVVLWGLCDAAAAIIFYAHQDPTVGGIVILNPWARTDAGQAKAYIKHYYRARFVDPAFWQKMLTGKLDILASGKSLFTFFSRAFSHPSGQDVQPPPELPQRLLEALACFRGRVLLIMSGNDLTAREFDEAFGSWETGRRMSASGRLSRHDLPEANHTFSRADWRDTVVTWTLDWVASLESQGL
jgi:exosortase A-associated hydrolase 1